MEGFIKYYQGTEQKGVMVLTPDARARFLNRTEMEIALPSNKKNYLLVAQDLVKCPPKQQYFSCDLEDWDEAINYVGETMSAENLP